MAFNDRTMHLLDQEMGGYRALQGLDLTYHVFGHVVDKEGTVVGLVFEAYVGRLMQFRDRALVYDAFSKVQQRGLIFFGADEFTNTHILNGKVRLTNLASIWHFPDEKLRKKHGEIRHWSPLESWFPALKAQNDHTPRPVYQRLWDHNVQLLPHISPDCPLLAWFTLDLPSNEDQAKRNDEFFSWFRRNASSRNRRSLPSSSTSPRDSAQGWHVARRPKGSGRHSDHRTTQTIPEYLQNLTSRSRRALVSELESEPVDYARALAVKIFPSRLPESDHTDKFEIDSSDETETMTGSTYYSDSLTSPSISRRELHKSVFVDSDV